MFDAKSLLENLVRNAAPQNAGSQAGGGLADILGQVLGGANNPAGQPQGAGGAGSLSDILGQLQRQIAPQQTGGAPGTGNAGGLNDILGQLKEQLGKAGTSVQGSGGVMDVLGQVLAQATQGVKEGAGKLDSATGASDALGKATGRAPADILAQLQDLVRDNPLAAGGALGGLGGLMIGTRTGRSIAGSAARLGALALIGGLAYKAFQNYQSGKPLIAGAAPLEAAPQGSGFEAAAASNEDAALYIQTMIAAAAADGRLDAQEQAKILGGLTQAGVGAQAEEFLANAFNRPVTVAQISDAVSSPEQAVQVYTAARIAIDPDTAGEKRFLAGLADALGIDAKLAQHIDATARAAA